MEIAEGALTKMRTKNRGAVMTSRVTTVYVESDLDSDDEYHEYEGYEELY